LDNTGTEIITAQTFRFSIWSSKDFLITDRDAAGAIVLAAPNYADWQEVHTITPNNNGTFSLELGSITPLPIIDPSIHKFLQVEIKPSGSPDTDYQLMDPTGDNGADANDRKTIASIPYAFKSDYAQKTDKEAFILDFDDTVQGAATGSIKLQFGNTLNKYLEYDFDNSYFNFNEDVNIEGDLTLTGTINGVNIALAANPTGTTSDTFEINTDGNGVILDSAGLTADRTVTFPDGNTIVVGENNPQIITNKTIDGDDNTLQDIPFTALKQRAKTILLIPEYQNMAILEDGTDNSVSVFQGFDDINFHQYYELTSARPTLQDIDVYIAVKIPEDFVGFDLVPIQIFIKSLTINITDNEMDITMVDTTNTAVPLIGATNLVSTVANTWIEKDITFGGAATFTAGDFIILKLNMRARSNNEIYASEIKLNYIGR